VATVNNYDPATNKINGASYDAAGNLISFRASALTYDAENRITSASQSGIGSTYYLYDGAGRRVQEVSTYNVEKVFVYDVFGQMAAESSLGAQSLPCTTCYIATDHLGSTRMVTDQNANVVGRHDYLPFGEEIAANTGGRSGLFGTQDFVNQKFTGQERDAETGLDFFQARYYSAALGRFNTYKVFSRPVLPLPPPPQLYPGGSVIGIGGNEFDWLHLLMGPGGSEIPSDPTRNETIE